ncbi:MAG TPA: GNAT family N-acetyltransferase [Longimicrobium sp.]|nr:GNAT family N-acetyltransferase [Longimicrobium sp.]
MTVVLQTPRLLLRELTDQDHEALYEMYRDERMNRYLGGPPPPREEYWRRVRETWPAYYARHGFGLWATVRRADGRLMGRCGLLSQEVDGERHVEVAYALAPEFWGRGYATEVARALRHHAFRTLDAPHLISLIRPENAASIAVAERNGMTFWKMADFRGYRVRVYRVTRREWEEAGDADTAGGSLEPWNKGPRQC